MLCKSYKAAETKQLKSKKGKKKKRAKGQKDEDMTELHFSNVEEEVFLKVRF